MKAEDIKRFFSKGPKISYPYDAMELIETIPVQMVYPVTNIISGYTIAGLFIACDTKIYKFFDIRTPPPEPDFKFRMINIDEKSYALEVALLFDNNKIMRLHLNPRNALVKEYLRVSLKKTIISFHFYNQDNGQMLDSITNLGEEEITWFERNAALARRLRTNPKFRTIVDIRAKQIKQDKEEMLFGFYRTTNPNLLVKNTTKLYRPDDREYFYGQGDK